MQPTANSAFASSQGIIEPKTRPILLIATCARYAKVCEATVASLAPLARWVQVVVITDKSLALPEFARQELLSDDPGWNTMIHKFASSLEPAQQVMLWMDDLVLESLDDEEIFAGAISWHNTEQVDYLSLYCPPWEQIARLAEGGVRYQKVEPEATEYPLSCMASLFQAGFLTQVLDPEENPWQFERGAKEKLARHPGATLHKLRFTPFTIRNIVVKGKVVPWRTAEPDGWSLPLMSRNASLAQKIKILAYSIFKLDARNLAQFLVS